MRFASLGSGSTGNALLVECGSTRLLIDCGFSVREVSSRLARLGLRLDNLTGILVTHEHGDHAGGVFRCARQFGLPVWLSGGTFKACGDEAAGADCRIIDSHSTLTIGQFDIFPFPVPHDAREPVQFVFSDGNLRLGLLTDAGEVTPHMCAMLSGCDGLILECNHDAAMLANSSYPAALTRRIGGRLGHLENAAAASLLARIDTSRLRHLVAAHLSERNNLPELAARSLSSVLGCAPDWIGVACPKIGFGWRSLED
ncbi:MAG: MBL fold metallo-hydrolase [Betaproteobacteria bacterium]